MAVSCSPVSKDRLEILTRKIAHHIGEAISEWGLIEEGDRILVGISGGKDSYTLLHFLRYLKGRSPVRFDFFAFHLDQGQPGFPSDEIGKYLEREGFPYHIVRKDTYTLVTERLAEGQTTCSLCSRYRRGILYNQAVELGATKIALGHHREDAIETLLLNLFYSGQLKGMPALLRSDDGRNTVIRPLIYVPEEEIREFAGLSGFPVVPCKFCTGTERDRIGRLLDQLSEENPRIKGNILAALRNVTGSHLLDPRMITEGGSSNPQSAIRNPQSAIQNRNQRTGRMTARTGAPSLPDTNRGSATIS
jgi:tRNA 2-thiocytidine biosynthesis protein TtcA